MMRTNRIERINLRSGAAAATISRHLRFAANLAYWRVRSQYFFQLNALIIAFPTAKNELERWRS